ncbi:MAG: amino acid adenylation domain-containing protein, partial [Gammaproteobacteria bacterium]|nr:amino acid adenylation domain-containing protein [Gammaproteobacteria bacterium]
QNHHPLSFAQQQMWLVCQLSEDQAGYTLPLSFTLQGVLNVERLTASINALVECHEVLRSSYVQDEHDDVFVQINQTPEKILEFLDLTALDSASQQQRLQTLASEQNSTIALKDHLMMKALLVKTAEDQHVLLMTFHHIATDGWSMGIISDFLSAAYGEGSLPMAAPALQYVDFTQWQRQHWQSNDVAEKLSDYWRITLDDLPLLHSLALDKTRPAVPTYQAHLSSLMLDGELTQRLNTFAKAHNITPFVLIQSLFSLTLAQFSAETDIVMGCPVANRTVPEVEGMIGYFVNSIVLRSQVDWSLSVSQWLKQQHQQIIAAFEHQELPFERVVEEINPERGVSHHPLFQIMFNYLGRQVAKDEIELTGIEATPFQGGEGYAKFDLTLTAVETEQGSLELLLDYSADIFVEATAERLLQQIQWFALQLLVGSDQMLSDLESVPPTVRKELCTTIGQGRTVEAEPFFFPERMARLAAEVPMQLAIHDEENTSLSFGELDQQANTLGALLQARGVMPGDKVAFLLPRNVSIVLAILAIHKVGAAYIPLDSSYPSERVANICAQAGVKVILSAAGLGDKFTFVDTVLDISSQDLTVEQALQRVILTADMPAYVLFTSGSTGEPKGVVVSHANLAHLIQTNNESIFKICALKSIRWGWRTPLVFDASLLGIITLATGGEVYIADEETRQDPLAFSHFIARHQINFTCGTPSFIGQMIDGWNDNIALPFLAIGGEATSPGLWSKLLAITEKNQVKAFNLYGPTECTLQCSYAEITEGRPHIGQPFDNTQLYVLDQQQRLLPMGAKGELYIAGDGVALGYLGKEELTATQFLANPFGVGKLYRTGDFVRWEQHHQLAYFSRLDDQVKLRGYRIELGEIEHALGRSTLVKQVVVAIKAQHLVAYYVLDSDVIEASDVTEQALREHAEQTLPSYMVPQFFIALEAIPYSVSGKVNKKALLAPDFSQVTKGYQAPDTDIERQIQSIWAEVLALPKETIGVTANFFALGGHSLTATKVVAQLSQQFKCRVRVSEIFSHPTIRGLSAVIAEHLVGRVEESRMAVVARQNHHPLSFAQQQMWLVCQLSEDQAG